MGLNTQNCIECGKTAPRLKKSMCNTCYERSRTSSKPKINLNCKNCGPIIGKKLTNGLCNKCYRIGMDPTTTQNCVSCNETKTNIFVKGICQACYSDKHRSENPEIYKTSRKKHKKEINENNKRWKSKNKGKVTAQSSKRRAKKLKAVPKWSNLEAIKQFYVNRPKGMEVDHIIPVCGDNVCGLHILENLQYLTKKENSIKSNSFDGTQNNDSWRSQC